MARSFRRLNESERASIREQFLHVAVAQEGESLGELGRRTGNQWNVQQTAVANDLFANARLSAGQLIKVSMLRPYEASEEPSEQDAPGVAEDGAATAAGAGG